MIIPLLLFYIGIITQAIFLLVDNFEKSDIWKFFGCIGIGLFAFIPGKHEYNYDLVLHLFLVAVFFAVIYSNVFKKKILQEINKEILLIWNLILIYIILRNSAPNSHLILILIGISSIPSIINIFFSLDKRYGWRVFLYVWFLCILVFIASSHITFNNLSFFFTKGTNIPTDGIEMFWLGGSFLYFAVNAWYILQLIPIAGKHQTEAERIAEVKEDMSVLESEYQLEDQSLVKSLLVIVIVVILLSLNYFENFFSDSMLISFLVAIIPIIDKLLFKKQSVLPQTTFIQNDPTIINTEINL